MGLEPATAQVAPINRDMLGCLTARNR